jgi:hypothetical protein
VAAAARRQRRQLGRGRQLGSGSNDGGGKKKQSTENSSGNSDGNGVCNNLRYTAFFEQSIPVWNRLPHPTYVGIQYWKKLYSLGISIFYIHT